MTSSSTQKVKASQSQSSKPRRSPRKGLQAQEKPTRAPRRCRTCHILLSECPHRFRTQRLAEVPAPPTGIPIDGPQDSPFGPQMFLNTAVNAAQTTGHASDGPQINASSGAQVELAIHSDEESDTHPLQEVSPTPAAGLSPIHRRPSNVQPIYSIVEGAGRGGMRLSVARVRELKPAFSDMSKATRKYEEWVKDLLTRAESISTRTKSWVYVAVHNPNSRTPFTHYTSSKLRKEAPDQVKKIHELVSQTMAALARAETREKVEIEAARLQAEVTATEVTARAVEAEQMVA
ncbi:hypothetical protein BKA70DRAFT_1429644 [Coprinopsis sp. MPI-PUGE-AT-0042]|nr:hypothetical protein BKA70DRAFT_1429644 [Coprinopsis sp. MPI-PUGE-AT-0042]